MCRRFYFFLKINTLLPFHIYTAVNWSRKNNAKNVHVNKLLKSKTVLGHPQWEGRCIVHRIVHYCSIADSSSVPDRSSADDAHRPSHRLPLWRRGRCDGRGDAFFIFNLVLFNFLNLYIFSLFSLIFHFFHSQIHTTYSTLQTK